MAKSMDDIVKTKSAAKPKGKTDAEATAEREAKGLEIFEAGQIHEKGSAFVFSDGDDTEKLRKDTDGRWTCTCDDYDGATTIGVPNYSCEHLYALDHVLVAEAEEDAKKQPGKQADQVFDDGELIEGSVPDDKEADLASEKQADEQAAAEDSFIESLADKEANLDKLAVLTTRLPKPVIKTRKVNWGRGFVEYIEWTFIPKLLNSAIGLDAWEYRVKDVQVHQKAVSCTGSLTILGITRENVGVCDIAGGNLDMAIKGAASDAIKRCAVLFGVALELYEKESDDEPQDGRPADFSKGSVSGRGPGPAAATQPPTEKQLDMLASVVRDKGMDLRDLEEEHQWGLDFDQPDLGISKKRCSEIIDEILKMNKKASW